ncbi:MAG: phosphonate C-P lyase system protein PhnH [Deltaproteobacteria bacterium]|nr:phosphonate C-P lyase system protein PhnH [Candidatus Anaeroferrophillus wilburensis]MBN2890189.1 phosphonate C-P lyase system protein PhnH [Deltaproteobacteria bacterium]
MLEIDTDRLNRVNFRACLAALSRPGSKHQLMPFRDSALLAMASLMLYSEVGYHYDGELDFRLVEAITGGSRRCSTDADFLFADHVSVPLLKDAKKGDHENPERGATLIFSVKNLVDGPLVLLEGPGIDGQRSAIMPVDEHFLEVFNHKNREFPCGVEVFFVSHQGELVALSRTTRMGKAS